MTGSLGNLVFSDIDTWVTRTSVFGEFGKALEELKKDEKLKIIRGEAVVKGYSPIDHLKEIRRATALCPDRKQGEVKNDTVIPAEKRGFNIFCDDVPFEKKKTITNKLEESRVNGDDLFRKSVVVIRDKSSSDVMGASCLEAFFNLIFEHYELDNETSVFVVDADKRFMKEDNIEKIRKSGIIDNNLLYICEEGNIDWNEFLNNVLSDDEKEIFNLLSFLAFMSEEGELLLNDHGSYLDNSSVKSSIKAVENLRFLLESLRSVGLIEQKEDDIFPLVFCAFMVAEDNFPLLRRWGSCRPSAEELVSDDLLKRWCFCPDHDNEEKFRKTIERSLLALMCVSRFDDVLSKNKNSRNIRTGKNAEQVFSSDGKPYSPPALRIVRAAREMKDTISCVSIYKNKGWYRDILEEDLASRQFFGSYMNGEPKFMSTKNCKNCEPTMEESSYERRIMMEKAVKHIFEKTLKNNEGECLWKQETIDIFREAISRAKEYSDRGELAIPH